MEQLLKSKELQRYVISYLQTSFLLIKHIFLQLHTQSDGTTVHTVQALDGQSENMHVDLSEALAQDGQLIITNEDGNGSLKNLMIA